MPMVRSVERSCVRGALHSTAGRAVIKVEKAGPAISVPFSQVRKRSGRSTPLEAFALGMGHVIFLLGLRAALRAHGATCSRLASARCGARTSLPSANVAFFDHPGAETEEERARVLPS